CVLYRMDSHERKIAAIPLTFAAIRFALGLTMRFHWSVAIFASQNNQSATLLEGLLWMPILCSAYLFYSPWKSSHTSRVIFWYSTALLLSGLIPGEGYLYIAALLFYTLFIAIGISLVMDFMPEKFADMQRPMPSAAAPGSGQAAFS